MFIPLHPILLDSLLSLSIVISFSSSCSYLYKGPLDFSTFPTFLLLATLFISSNVATTRNILLDSPKGDVSQVITSFGDFVVGGYFVGFVIFLILVIINFVIPGASSRGGCC